LVLLRYESPELFKLHLGSAWNNGGDNDYERLYNVSRSYKALTYVWLSKALGLLDFSAIWLNDAFHYGATDGETGKKAYRNTLGGNLGLKNKDMPVSFYATAYYQSGHNAVNNPLSACLLALNVQYKPAPAWNVTAGSDYFSGSTAADVSANKDKTFNKLYGSNHSFNGFMEYWTTLPAQGLVDLYGGLSCKPGARLSLDATFHAFSVARELTVTTKKAIGSELDFTAGYNLSAVLAIQGGWSFYLKNDQTDILKRQVNADTRFPQWGYVMVSFKPKFFTK
jgi:hypothetical protein